MRTAVVVGAGIGGLAVAGALARTGWNVTLLEREDRLRASRAAYILWPNGIRALGALGLSAGLDGISTPVPATGIRRPDGQWLLQPSAVDDSQHAVVIHGEDLHDTFVAGLGDHVDVRTGVTVTVTGAKAAPERPAVSDGRNVYEADLVVAADGTESVVRRRLVPATKFASTGFAAWRAVVPWYRAPQLPDGVLLNGETLGTGHRFVSASLDDRGERGASRGGIYWMATAPGASRPEPAETQLALLRRWFAGWHSPIGELLAATETIDLVHDPVGELRPLPDAFGFPYGAGGYALVGDAAHAMTHHLSQGGCLALEDAATLQALLADAVPGRTLGPALARYTQLRRARVARVTAQSRRIGSVLQARGRFAVRARDLTLVRLAPRLIDRANAAACDWRPLA